MGLGMVIIGIVVVHELVNLVPSLVRFDMVEVEVFCMIRQDHWEDRMVLVFVDFELSIVTDEHPCLVIQDVIWLADIILYRFPYPLECRHLASFDGAIVYDPCQWQLIDRIFGCIEGVQMLWLV